MAKKDFCSRFKDYCSDLEKKTRKNVNKKSHKGRYYGGLSQPSLKDLEAGKTGGISGSNGKGAQPPGAHGLSGNGTAPAGGGNGGGGMGESVSYDETNNYRPEFIFKNSRRGMRFMNFMNGTFSEEDYEEDAETPTKKDQARTMYQALTNSGQSRQDIINAYQTRLGLTQQSAVAYFERIAKEFGHTGDQPEQPGMAPGAQMGQDQMGGAPMGGGQQEQPTPPPEPPMEPQEWEDPNRQGEIRTVPGAHLVYKRQTDDGTFEELWVYKQGKEFQDEIQVRRDILAGTDIPVTQTTSDDGSQESDTWSIGNVQLLNISGLPN